MNLATPRFRRDLIVTPQRDEGGLAYVVKDPATGRFFRLRAPEHFIAQQLDGATGAETVRERVRTRFGESPSSNSLAEFLEELQRQGLFEGQRGEAADRGHLARSRRVRGNLLYLRFKAFDPDRLLTRLVAKLGFAFSPWAVAASAVAILVGLLVVAANWDDLQSDVARLFRPETVVFMYVTLLVVGMAHEFAHGLTCKRFGGEVHEMGFLLLYLQPALYCNVSDAWLFPERWKRLWVTFAGAYLDLFVWGLATIAWRISAPDTWPNLAALIVMATSGLKTLFNLNPLIKLDGYYLLSDYLEIPNLRRRSFDYLWGLVRRRAPPVTRRERWIFAAYGALAAAFSVSAVVWLAIQTSGFLTAQMQGFGFVLFLTLFSFVLRRRFPRIVRAPRALARVRQRIAARTPKSVALFGAAGAGAFLLFCVPLPLHVSGSLTVLPTRNADVRTQVEGLIQEVYVVEGQSVRAGDPVARLSARRHRADLDKAVSSIDERRARLRMLVAGPTPEQIDLARSELATARTKAEQARRRHVEAQQMLAEQRAKSEIAVSKAQVRVDYAKLNIARCTQLEAIGLISVKDQEQAAELAAVTEKELEEARAEQKLLAADTLAVTAREVSVAETEVGQAEARLAVLLAGSREEEIDALRAEISTFEAEQHFLESEITLLDVVSPIDGTITTPARQLVEMRGKLVKPGELIAEVYDLERVSVEIAVPEADIAAVRIGLPVALKVRAYPDHVFRGQVTSIAATLRGGPAAPAAAPAPLPGPRAVRVTSQLDNRDRLLKAEMTGVAKISGGERSLAGLLVRRCSRLVKLEFWSWW